MNFGIRERIQTIFNNLNIGPKLILYILVPLIILLLMLSAVFYLYSSNFLEKRANLSLFSQSGAISNEIQHYIKNAEGDLGALLTNRMIMDYSMYSEIGLLDYAEDARWKVEKDFLRIVEEKPEYATIRIIGLDGKSLVDVIDRKISYRHFNFSKEDWFVNTLKLENIRYSISPLHLCKEHQKPGVLISRLYYDDAGRKRGVGSLHFHIDEYFSELLERTIGENGYIYLVNKDGIIVGHKDRSKIGENIKDFKSTQNVLAGNRGTITEIDENNKVLMKKAYIPLKIDGLNLVVSQPMSEIKAVARRFILFNLILLIATVSIVSVITYIAIKRFIKPIIEIQNAVAEIAGGNLNKTINIEADILKCWEIMKCEKKNCPAYLNKRIPCWFVTGTFCYSKIQGNYTKKIGDCVKCIVYKKFKGDEIQKLRIGFNEMTIKLKESYTILEEKVKERTKKLEKEIFERKKAEEELRTHRDHLEELVQERTSELAVALVGAQESDRLKSAFLASMSHELRTPLNSIIGFTGIILQGMVGELNDEQRKQLNMVSGSAKHLLGLINDILDISKIAAGKVEIGPSRFEVAELTQMVEKMVSPMAAEKGLKLGISVSDGTPSAIYSDNDRIKQVLINLLSNAVKFTESGEIELMVRPSMLASGASPEELEKEELSGIKADQAASLVFSVSDTGIGIKTESLADVFDEFKQIEGPLTMKAGGTGLGLAISKKMVEMMGGRIWAESEYGKGSCFHFTVPIGVTDR